MSDWHTLTLGEVATLQRGFDLPQRLRRRGNIPIVSSAGVSDYHNTAMVDPPGVVTGRYGTIGELFFVDEPFWPLNTTLYVRDFHGNDPLFIYYHLQRFNFAAFSGKSGVPGVNRNDLHSETVTLPVDIEEQRAIATALSDVDGLLGGLDRLISKKRDLKQAAMQQLLTRKSRLPGYHEEWEVKQLGKISDIAIGRTPLRLNKAVWGHGHKWLSIADLQAKVACDSNEEITEIAAATMAIVPKGTLLMSFKLSIGRLCFAGCDLFTNEAICSFGKLQADPEYLYYALGRIDFSHYGKQAVKGYTLNKESLKTIEFCLPHPSEQNAIAEVLTDMDEELAALEQRRDKTRALKQAMMQELLTGRTRLV